MVVPRSVEVAVDSREKYPLLFPENIEWHKDRSLGRGKRVAVKARSKTLKTGDYLLSKWPHKAIVERKGSIMELHQNLLTKDFGRFMEAITRLTQECEYPYLLIDASPSELWKPSKYAPDPAKAWDSLCSVVSDLGIRLLWAGNAKKPGPRRILGEQILRLLMSHALR